MNTMLIILALVWILFLGLAAAKSKVVAVLYVLASVAAMVFYQAGTRSASEVKDVKTSVVSTASSAADVVTTGWDHLTSN